MEITYFQNIHSLKSFWDLVSYLLEWIAIFDSTFLSLRVSSAGFSATHFWLSVPENKVLTSGSPGPTRLLPTPSYWQYHPTDFYLNDFGSTITPKTSLFKFIHDISYVQSN